MLRKMLLVQVVFLITSSRSAHSQVPSPLTVRDITQSSRFINQPGMRTQYYYSVPENAWNTRTALHLIGATGTTHTYPGASADGALQVMNTFGSKAPAHHVTLTGKNSSNADFNLTVFFPSWDYSVTNKKTVFYVTPDGSTFYGDAENDGWNFPNEVLSPTQAITADHIAQLSYMFTGSLNSYGTVNGVPQTLKRTDTYEYAYLVSQVLHKNTDGSKARMHRGGQAWDLHYNIETYDLDFEDPNGLFRARENYTRESNSTHYPEGDGQLLSMDILAQEQIYPYHSRQISLSFLGSPFAEYTNSANGRREVGGSSTEFYTNLRVTLGKPSNPVILEFAKRQHPEMKGFYLKSITDDGVTRNVRRNYTIQ